MTTHVLIALETTSFCVGIFTGVWICFWVWNRKALYVYFDAQDFAKSESGASRRLPLSAATGTFAPFLQHYIDVAKLLITVAAASIAFGGGQATQNETTMAKLILAFSILYGLLFCASMLYMYDEYGQNMEAYTRFWYSTVESLGASALLALSLATESGLLAWFRKEKRRAGG
jgi:hypothetical protein